MKLIESQNKKRERERKKVETKKYQRGQSTIFILD